MRETTITLPTLHPDQVKAYQYKSRHKAIRCGRRWGKTALAVVIVVNDVIRGKSVGWFVPQYKILSEAYRELADLLHPLIVSASKIEGVIRLNTGGRIDFWSLENERAGRSRKYHTIIIDEAAFAGPNMIEIWERAIEPTLVDYRGSAWALSTPNGDDPKNFFWKVCNEPKLGFVEYYAPSSNNPYLPPSEIEHMKQIKHPLVFAQEYLAKFIDFSGDSLFLKESLLVNGEPLPYPRRCEQVFATMDTAVKSGLQHDATAVVYWAYDRFNAAPLKILDYDIVRIDGYLLESWVPRVFARVEELARECGAVLGPDGVIIEDKQTGSVLLQQALSRGWPARPVESKMTALGKSERAIASSNYVFQGLIKITQHAHDKIVRFDDSDRNHLLSQIARFRVGDKSNAAAADDLFDCFCFGILTALGNSDGY